MNIMELGAIGELVGGVAVIATLIYLAMQIRQSNRLEKAESIRATTRDQFRSEAIVRIGRIDLEVSKERALGVPE